MEAFEPLIFFLSVLQDGPPTIECAGSDISDS